MGRGHVRRWRLQIWREGARLRFECVHVMYGVLHTCLIGMYEAFGMLEVWSAHVGLVTFWRPWTPFFPSFFLAKGGRTLAFVGEWVNFFFPLVIRSGIIALFYLLPRTMEIGDGEMALLTGWARGHGGRLDWTLLAAERVVGPAVFGLAWACAG